MFTGKGGVGKTTCAAATALHHVATGAPTLTISTDATPSLSHIFEIATDIKPARVLPSLYINELGEEEIKEIQNSLKAEKDTRKESLFQTKYIKLIMFAVAIAMFNQLSGINALMYYAPRIFQMAGFAKSAAMLSSVGVGFVNLIFTMTALLIIDHFGRKKQTSRTRQTVFTF